MIEGIKSMLRRLRGSKKSSEFFLDREEEFSIDRDAEKLGMTVEEYRRTVLFEKPKKKLAEIYKLHEEEMELVEKEKQKFNEEVMSSWRRQRDFQELDDFMDSLKNYG